MPINLPAPSAGGKFVKLNAQGAKITGTILDIEERVKTFEGAPVLSRKTGKPRIEHLLKLATDERDDDFESDEGVRLIPLNEFQWEDFLKAHVKAGSPADVEGWTITVKCATPRAKPTESDTYAFKFGDAPKKVVAIDDDEPF